MRKEKRKHVTSFSKIKKVIRETGKSHPPAEDELSLYSGSDLDEQIDQLVDTTKSQKVNFASNNNGSQPEESDEDDLIKDIANNYSAVEKHPSIGKNLASIINNVMFNSVRREKVVQKLEKQPRQEHLNSLKIKKCNPEIWHEMLQSKD